MQSQVGSTGFWRRFQRSFGAEPGQVQQGSGEGSGEGLGGFGAEPGQVQQGSGEGSGEGLGGFGAGPGFRRRFQRRSGRLWCKARSGSTGFRNRVQRRSRESLVQSQVKFNRVPKKVQEKVGGCGAERSSSTWYRARPDSKGFRRRFRRRFRKRLWCRARSGSTGFRRRFQRLASQHASERFVKIKRCGCWGYHRSLFPHLPGEGC